MQSQNLKTSKLRRWRGRPTGPWITARKTVQYLALLAFIVLLIGSRQGGWPPSLVNFPMRLDPLLTLTHLLASHALLSGSLISLLVVLLTLVFGRAWCGWLCPLGTVFDIFTPGAWRKKPIDASQPPESLRSLKYILLVAILVAALLGNLTLLFLDPLTLLFRSLTTSLWPAFDQAVTFLETHLYQVPFLSGPISNFDAWVRPAILPSEPVFYRAALLFSAVLLSLILLNLVAPRFWCRYLCPLGGFLGVLSKLALFRRSVSDECKGCTLCTQSCPTGTVDPARHYASDPSECTMCLDCLEVCPRSNIDFTPGLNPAAWQPYDPSRRQALATLGVTLAALALFKSDALAKREPPHLLRPPGARENNLLSKCVRCAECMRACPTSALQPSFVEAGLEGFWTPVLLPRLGYCDYSCNACGQVCPVQAIPPLSLDEKRVQVIGKAYIDQNRCLAWSDHTDCIVCEEMCPLPQKAVYLEDAQVQSADGNLKPIKLPHMNRDLCIGCGICEYKCPVNGEAAIRVYVPTTQVPF